LVPNRHGSTDDYRYGFQGQEKDDEIKGEGNSLNYTFRMHDPRVGRFFAPDPLEKKYPFYSPYQFSGNRVIDMVELEGLEPAQAGNREGQKGDAFDDRLVTDNPIDAISYPFSYQTWTWHAGTKTTAAGWKTEDEYKQTVMPFAIDLAQSKGWSYGLTWESAKLLINNPGEETNAISAETMDFLTSRNQDASLGADLVQMGAHEINSANKAKFFSATGSIEQMDFSSPLFGMGFGLRGLATGSSSKAVVFGELPQTGSIDPFQVRFSQNSISSKFKNGNSVFDVSKISDDIPAIRIVEKDGLIYTLDNRRLKLFQEANVPIKYEKLNAIPKKEAFKFTTENFGTSIRVRD